MGGWKQNSLGGWYRDDEYRSPNAGKTFTAPKKKKTKGQQLEESGQYLKDPETEVDTSQPLKSESFDIDPNLIPDTESQRRLKDKLRSRAGSGQEGSKTAEDFLKKKGGNVTDLPQFLKIKSMQEAYERENIGNPFDKALNPDGTFKEPTLEQLKEGVELKKKGIDKQSALDAANQLTEFAQDWRAFKTGAIAGALVDGPLPAGELIGGFGAVALRRLGAETIIKPALRQIKKEALDFTKRILKKGYKAKYAMAGGGEIVEEAVEQTAKATPLQMTGSGGKELISSKITKSNRDTLQKMGLGEDWKVFNVDENLGKYTRKQTKAINAPDYKAFTKTEAEKIKIPELQSYYLNLDPKEILIELDHINPLKITSYLMDGTTKAERLEIRKILLDNGLYSGDMPKNLQALPREVHKIWTDSMNQIMGKKLDVFLKEMSDQGITSNKKMAVEYAKRINDARKKFNIIYREHRATFGSVNWNTPENIDNLVTALDMAADLGPNWQPARIKKFVQEINQNLSDLDTNPLNLRPKGNAGLQQVVSKLGLDSKNIESLSELTSVKDQMDYIREISGMGIEEIDQLIRTTNFDIDGFLKGLKLKQ